MDLSNLNKDKDQKKRRRSGVDMTSQVYGKVAPQAQDLEIAILGVVMIEQTAIDIVNEILKPECFYNDAHRRIFEAITRLSQKSQRIDVLLVCEELKTSEELDLVGGAYYITKLTNWVVSAANLEPYCRIVLQKFIQREIIRIGGEAIRDAYEDTTDVFDLLEKVETDVMNITLHHLRKDFTKIDDGLLRVVKRIEHLRTQDHSITGVTSGYKKVDDCTHGWQPTDLIILAARPGVGKTAFALNLARNALIDKIKPTGVGFFSLEMSLSQLIERFLSTQSEIWLSLIRRGKLGDDFMQRLYTKGIQPIAGLPFYIDDSAGINMFELRSKARRMVAKYGVGLIIIDYLQLMSGDNNKYSNREQEISKISRELKKLAKDLQVPIIALSQLSREVEKRGKGMKVPQLSDLRESGAIEQDADLVAFLYRPPEDEVKEDAALGNRGMLKIAKHRNGNLEEIVFEVNLNIQKWSEISDLPPGNWRAVEIPNLAPPTNYSEPTRASSDDEDLPF